MRSPSAFAVGLALAVAAAATPSAQAQLGEGQVLVVYDSRVPDSLAVARHYAGSAKVPSVGGPTVVGARPGVHVFDLASMAGAGVGSVQADIDYTTFISAFRDPIRVRLASLGLTDTVRCIVLTRGLPHRILHTPNPSDSNQFPGLGDNPGFVSNVLCSANGGNVSYSSVDAELTLLQQNLNANEAGAPADSFMDGMIINPYWKSGMPIGNFPTTNILTPKTFVLPNTTFSCGGPALSFNGIYWLNGAAGAATTLTPGDMYLVCRLDAGSLAGAISMIDRARNILVNQATATIVLDKDSQGFDASGATPPALSAGTDYAQASGLFSTTNRRYAAANVRYNTADNWAAFLVGPNVSYSPQTPVVVTTPVLLLASYGANHSAASGTRIDSTPAATTWGTSFNFAPGAVFNTFESYNGRAYNGLGQNPFVFQQQSADVLNAGATFAVAHVWEPLAWAAADNFYIAHNFLLGSTPALSGFIGGQTWAEAAYTSIPVLSWQHIVLGDPLAKVRRMNEDVNGDGVVDVNDLYAFRLAPVDLNNSTTSDETDYRLLESAVRGFEHTDMKGRQR